MTSQSKHEAAPPRKAPEIALFDLEAQAQRQLQGITLKWAREAVDKNHGQHIRYELMCAADHLICYGDSADVSSGLLLRETLRSEERAHQAKLAKRRDKIGIALCIAAFGFALTGHVYLSAAAVVAGLYVASIKDRSNV